MKNVQKLVLVPIEKWKQIGDNSPMKEVSVETAPLMNPASSQESNFSTESEQSRRFRKNREIESNSDVPLSFSEEEK